MLKYFVFMTRSQIVVFVLILSHDFVYPACLVCMSVHEDKMVAEINLLEIENLW